MIKTLEDVTLVPTTVECFRRPGGHYLEDQMRARLFPDLEGNPFTLVTGSMMGEPVVTVGHFISAEIRPRPSNYDDSTEWRLLLCYRAKRKQKAVATDSNFQTSALILLRAWPALDLSQISRVPLKRDDDHRYRDESYPTLWRLVSAHCAEVAGAERVLIDTTESAPAECRP